MYPPHVLREKLIALINKVNFQAPTALYAQSITLEPDELTLLSYALGLATSTTLQARPPPLGVLPVRLWEERHPKPTDEDIRLRVELLADAMRRHIEAGLSPRTEWLDEVLARMGSPAGG